MTFLHSCESSVKIIYSCIFCSVLFSCPLRYYQYILAKRAKYTHTRASAPSRPPPPIYTCHLLFLFSELVIFSLFSERNFYIFMMLKAFFPGRRHFKNSLPVTPNRPGDPLASFARSLCFRCRRSEFNLFRIE